MPVAPDKRTDPGAFLLTSSRPNVFNARSSEMGQRYLFPFVKKEMRLRTFARLFSNIDLFLKILPLKDNGLEISTI